ncbi:hypothetical protein ACFL96_05910 [Thermoproteota archaeon]
MQRTGLNDICSKAVLGASHNKYPSREIADERIKTKAWRDMMNGSDCVSYNFLRAEGDDIDENKFLMPVIGHIPVVAFQIVYALMHGLDTAVVGSREVGRVVEAIQASKNIPRVSLDRLVFVDEGNELSMGNTLMRGAEALDIKGDDRFFLLSGDIPLGFDYIDMMTDKEWADHVMIMHVNARQRMFPSGEEFIPRNYYHVLVNGGGEELEFKEPNVWQFSKQMLDRMEFVSNTIYSNRQGGGVGVGEILRMAGKDFLKDWKNINGDDIAVLAKNLRIAISNQSGEREQYRINQRFADKFATYIAGGPSLVKADHSNPWLMKDIDARHDLWFYMRLFNIAKKQYGSLSEMGAIVPHANRIGSLEGVMHELGQEIPMISNFAEIENARAKKIGMEKPFDDYGLLIAEPSPGENLYRAFIDLEQRTIDYFQKLATYMSRNSMIPVSSHAQGISG